MNKKKKSKPFVGKKFVGKPKYTVGSINKENGHESKTQKDKDIANAANRSMKKAKRRELKKDIEEGLNDIN